MSPVSPSNDGRQPEPGVARATPARGALARAGDWLFRGTALFGMACLIGAGLVTVTDIVLRALGTALFGAVDLVQLLIMATAFTAIPYAFHRDSHVSVDILTQALPRRLQQGLRAATALLAAAVMALILVYGWEAAKLQMMFGDKSQNIGIPMIWYWAPLVAGAGLSVLACLVAALSALLSPASAPDPASDPASGARS